MYTKRKYLELIVTKIATFFMPRTKTSSARHFVAHEFFFVNILSILVRLLVFLQGSVVWFEGSSFESAILLWWWHSVQQLQTTSSSLQSMLNWMKSIEQTSSPTVPFELVPCNINCSFCCCIVKIIILCVWHNWENNALKWKQLRGLNKNVTTMQRGKNKAMNKRPKTNYERTQVLQQTIFGWNGSCNAWIVRCIKQFQIR